VILRLARVKSGVLAVLRADGFVDRPGADRIHGNVHRASRRNRTMTRHSPARSRSPSERRRLSALGRRIERVRGDEFARSAVLPAAGRKPDGGREADEGKDDQRDHREDV
jgi:hypothetical protein